MKAIRYTLLGVILVSVPVKSEQEPYRVILEAKWKNLQDDPQRVQLFGGKWILAGSITFKKRTSDIVFLDELQLAWEGEKLNELIGSLYEKNDKGNFLPIEKYHVCDSNWKRSTQELFLKFNEPLTLGAVNTFYLVLTVPEEVEPKIKGGKFRVSQRGLPLPYREYVKQNELCLTINDRHPVATTV